MIRMKLLCNFLSWSCCNVIIKHTDHSVLCLMYLTAVSIVSVVYINSVKQDNICVDRTSHMEMCLTSALVGYIFVTQL